MRKSKVWFQLSDRMTMVFGSRLPHIHGEWCMHGEIAHRSSPALRKPFYMYCFCLRCKPFPPAVLHEASFLCLQQLLAKLQRMVCLRPFPFEPFPFSRVPFEPMVFSVLLFYYT